MRSLKAIICLLTAVSVLVAVTNVRLELNYNYSSSTTLLLAENTDDSETEEDEFWEEWKRDHSDNYQAEEIKLACRTLLPGMDYLIAYLGGTTTTLSAFVIALIEAFSHLLDEDYNPSTFTTILLISAPLTGPTAALLIADNDAPVGTMLGGAALFGATGAAIGAVIGNNKGEEQIAYIYCIGALLAPAGAAIGYRHDRDLCVKPETRMSGSQSVGHCRKIPEGADYLISMAGSAILAGAGYGIMNETDTWVVNSEDTDLKRAYHVVDHFLPLIGAIVPFKVFDSKIPMRKTLIWGTGGAAVGWLIGIPFAYAVDETRETEQWYFSMALSAICAPIGATIGYRKSEVLCEELGFSVHPPSFEFTNTTYPDGSVELSTKLVLLDVRF